jgi:hypothetical protein
MRRTAFEALNVTGKSLGGKRNTAETALGIPALAGAWRTAEVPDVAKLPPAKARVPSSGRINDREHGTVQAHRRAVETAGANPAVLSTELKWEGLAWFILALSALATLALTL